MSVDFYVALPAGDWPTAAQVQQCIAEQRFPIAVQRWPSPDPARVQTDGALLVLDGTPAYLEGEIFSSIVAPQSIAELNERLATSGSPQIGTGEAVMSIRVRSPSEMRAASYLIASLVICFDGFGFEPQGNTSGRADFANALLAGAEALREVR